MYVYILKCKSTSRFAPFSWLVQFFQKTKWSHYALEYDFDHKTKVTDASRKGIRKMPVSKWAKKYKVYHRIKIKLPCDPYDFNEWILSKIGIKYGYFQLIGIEFITMGIIKRNPFGRNMKNLVCHEWVLVILARFLKIDIGDSDDYDFKKADKIIDSVDEYRINYNGN